MQELTARMRVRIEAFVALKDALNPSFCEGMDCISCPLHSGLPGQARCKWMETNEAIDLMNYVLHGITLLTPVTPPTPQPEAPDPDTLELT